MSQPVSTAPNQTQEDVSRHRGVLGGLILVCIGLTALFATWLPGGGAWLFFGLGSAFALARIITGRPGYAVPAGIMLGFGAFVWLTEVGLLVGPASGGVFFICLGLGFLVSYAITARPSVAWPILPGLLLIGFGAFVEAMTSGESYAQFWWAARYWPIALVAVGAWLLLRHWIPARTQAPVAVAGAAVLIALGLLVAASAVVMSGVPYSRAPMPMPMPMPWPVFPGPIGVPPIQDTVTLTAPAADVTAIQLTNGSGSTVVRATSANDVKLQATRHYWRADQAPDVRLVPSGRVLAVETSAFGSGATNTYVDYVVEVPAQLGADIHSASGSVAVTGLAGSVQVVTASGDINAQDLSGSASLLSASGAIDMRDIAGDLRVTSASGAIRGTGLTRVLDAHSMSGSIDLVGDFGADAQVTSTSGSVSLGLSNAASLHLEASSTSGDVRASNLELAHAAVTQHSLSGDLQTAAYTLSVRTTSGSIHLFRSA